VTQFFKVISVLSVGLGPLASSQIPAMAPDLRPWAQWLSGIFAAGALLWANARVSRRRTISLMFGDLKWSVCALLASGVLYFLINLFWTKETGGLLDVLFTALIVLAYVVCFASLTFALVIGEKLTKQE